MKKLSKNIKIYECIFPSYIKKFTCIGSKCTDTCCAGWEVSIDKKTYLKYKNYNGDNKELKNLFKTSISRNRKINSITSYGKIKNCRYKCPFLNEDRLCKIHMYLGEKYLSNTCNNYPRIYKNINNVLEYSASLSCPEIAKLALKNKDGITFESEKIKFKSDIIFNSYNNNNLEKDNLVIKYFFDIQSIALSILQCKTISLENSIILIGALSKEISSVLKEKNSNIDNIILKYSDVKYLETYSESLKNIKPFYSSQLEIFSNWIKLILRNKESSKYDKFLKEAMENIFKENNFHENNKLNFYEKIGIDKYKKFIEKKSYILENYLVNLFFLSGYPINENFNTEKRNDIFLSYMNLTITFIILRTTIIGLLINKKYIKEETLINIVQSFSKRIYHNRIILDSLIEQMKIKDLYSYSASILMLNL